MNGNIKFKISMKQLIFKFLLYIIILLVIFNLCISFVNLKSIIYLILNSIMTLVFSILITDILSEKYVIDEDIKKIIINLNTVVIILFFISLFINLYIGYNETYNKILNSEKLYELSGAYLEDSELIHEYFGTINKEIANERFQIDKRNCIKEAIIYPILNISISHMIIIIISNTYFMKKFKINEQE